MEHIQSAVIQNIRCNDIITHHKQDYSRKLLDLSKSYDQYDLIERTIYDISKHNARQLKINDLTKCHIEFWFKNEHTADTGLHVDCDEYLKNNDRILKHPLLSCIVYLNDNEVPTVITNQNIYETKRIVDLLLFMSKPRQSKMITFLPFYYHGAVTFNNTYDGNNRHIMAINIWNTQPSHVEYYTSTEIGDALNYAPLVFIPEQTQTLHVDMSSDIMNQNLFNAIKKSSTDYNYAGLIDSINYKEYSNVKITQGRNIGKEPKELFQLKNTYDDVANDIDEMMIDSDKIRYNRFQQRFVYEQFLKPSVCDWIIFESERYAKNNNGWTIDRHKQYPTTDLPICKIETIFSFVTLALSDVTEKIIKSYNLPDNITLNYTDLFVVKYKHDEQNGLEMHRDGSLLSFNLLLSNTNSFLGGGTYFEDGITIKPSQGDLTIHCGKTKHGGLPITNGVRYILVGFLELKKKVV